MGHLADGVLQKFISIPPRSCGHPMLEEDAAVLHGDASPALCPSQGQSFVPACVPSRDLRVPGDSGASRAF